MVQRPALHWSAQTVIHGSYRTVPGLPEAIWVSLYCYGWLAGKSGKAAGGFLSPESGPPQLNRLLSSHARARDVDAGAFKDFVLGLMAQPALVGPSQSSAANDRAWTTFVTLVIGPTPALKPAQQEAVAMDCGMTDGRLVLPVREAVVFYVRQRLGLHPAQSTANPETQHLALISAN